MSDLEHDTQEEFGGRVGAAPKPPPELSDSALDRIDAMEALERQRKQQTTMSPTDRNAMLAGRYQVRSAQEEQRLAAGNAEWLALDNEILFVETE